MKKTDVKVGEDYALGSTGSYSRWRMIRATVLDLNGEGIAPGRMRPAKGIKVRFKQDTGWSNFGSHKAGAEGIVTGRDIQMPWAVYEKEKDEHDAGIVTRDRERNRQIDVAAKAAERLRALGVDVASGSAFHAPVRLSEGGKVFKFTADGMTELLDRITRP